MNDDHENSDVALPFLGYLLGGFILLLVAVPAALFLIYPASTVRQNVTAPRLQSSQPKLQLNAAVDWPERLHDQDRRLSEFVDNPGSPKTFQIPIERAIDLLAARGLSGWPHP